MAPNFFSGRVLFGGFDKIDSNSTCYCLSASPFEGCILPKGFPSFMRGGLLGPFGSVL